MRVFLYYCAGDVYSAGPECTPNNSSLCKEQLNLNQFSILILHLVHILDDFSICDTSKSIGSLRAAQSFFPSSTITIDPATKLWE